MNAYCVHTHLPAIMSHGEWVFCDDPHSAAVLWMGGQRKRLKTGVIYMLYVLDSSNVLRYFRASLDIFADRHEWVIRQIDHDPLAKDHD